MSMFSQHRIVYVFVTPVYVLSTQGLCICPLRHRFFRFFSQNAKTLCCMRGCPPRWGPAVPARCPLDRLGPGIPRPRHGVGFGSPGGVLLCELRRVHPDVAAVRRGEEGPPPRGGGGGEAAVAGPCDHTAEATPS